MRSRLAWMAAAVVIVAAGCVQDVKTSIPYSAVPLTGDAQQGEHLFAESVDGAPPCASCHASGSSASPTLAGLSTVAGQRVSGESAREYVFYSIAEPSRFVVEGFGNAMYNRYDEKLTPQQIADLIAYLLTL